MDDFSSKDLSAALIAQRQQHPAWQLLASRRAPLVLSCLKPLHDVNHEGIAVEDAEQNLLQMLAEHVNSDEYQIEGDNLRATARKELREWIKRKLIVERDGRIIATDALLQALQFVDGLQDRVMTSTASRLATVQREIESLETRLNPNAQSRVSHIQQKIQDLEEELRRAEGGDIEVLAGRKAVEGIREVYTLAMSLRADFRRVEDSYRSADRELRHSIIGDQYHRGEIVDKLLDSHDDLIETQEGQVFHGFHEQLNQSTELVNMRHQLRYIVKNSASREALNAHQLSELRWLVASLVRESRRVLQARARSERDVKGFLKTGLAAEHHRVGELLNAILEEAVNLDWSKNAVRRVPSNLPPVGISMANLPLIERLRYSAVDEDAANPLQLLEQRVDLDDIGDEFWNTFDTLDQYALVEITLSALEQHGGEVGLAELCDLLPPSHDLETLSIWLAMARDVELPIQNENQSIELTDQHGKKLRFQVPLVYLSAAAFRDYEWLH